MTKWAALLCPTISQWTLSRLGAFFFQQEQINNHAAPQGNTSFVVCSTGVFSSTPPIYWAKKIMMLISRRCIIMAGWRRPRAICEKQQKMAKRDQVVGHPWGCWTTSNKCQRNKTASRAAKFCTARAADRIWVHKTLKFIQSVPFTRGVGLRICVSTQKLNLHFPRT